jgi:hypothetical protein
MLRALLYAIWHPYEMVYITVVRRYADAQKHFIGELYVGEGRTAKMIGMSCDNLPFNPPAKTAGTVRWGRSFLDAMEPNTILAGGQNPEETRQVHEYFALRRFCMKAR